MAEVIPLNWRNSIEELRQKISEAIRRWFAKFKRDGSAERELGSPAVFKSMGYGIELDEDDDKLIARATLPGLRKNDFKVEVTEDRLVIRGGKRHSSKQEGRGFSRYAEEYAAFARAISLPCEVDTARVKANYKNGVLAVTLPKNERAKSRRLRIQVNG